MATENENKPAKRDGSGRVPFANAKPGENSRYLRHAFASFNLPPLDISDPAQVHDRVMWYFEHCAEDDIRPSIVGLANALGISRNTLWEWRTGRSRAESDGHADTIKKACYIIEQMDADGLRDGKTNPAAGIFLLKNNFGYQDKQDLVLTPNNPLGDAVTPKQIADAIEADIIED